MDTQHNYNSDSWNNNSRRLSPNDHYNRTYNGSNGVNGRQNNNNRNNGYNGNSNGNDNNDKSERRIKPPRDWRSFSEIKFKVSNNIHLHADVTDLMEAFSAYGSVHRVEILTEETIDAEERPTGVFYVIFKPVPNYAFWEHPVRFHGNILRIDYQKSSYGSDTFTDQTDGRQKLKFHSFQAECLEMGCYLQPDTFVSEAKFTEVVKFTIDYQRRKIIVEFGVRDSQTHRSYKFEICFKDITSDIYSELDASRRRSRGTITIENKYPAKYWLLDMNLKSKNNFNWCIDDSWKRVTEIKSSKSNNDLSFNGKPGKWLVFRITFDLDQVGKNPTEGLNRFKELIEKAGEYNLTSRPVIISNLPLKIVNGTDLHKYVNSFKLNFEVHYMLHSVISHNFLNEYNLDEEFYSLLSQIPIQHAVNIFEEIYSRKKRIYDPLSYLRSESESMKLRSSIENKPRHIPHYCGMVRKVVVTPTTSYILTPTIETSNRVIRHFHDKKDNFLRVQFVDEALNKVGSSNGNIDDDNNLALYDRVYSTLHFGIKIGDRHYEFLAFSASQLRDHSCWFFSPTEFLTADKVRRWMGNFSTNKSVAKYAARMGQCFSSTRAIQKLPVDDIKEIPDIERNGYTFSDGVGNISFSLAKKIAFELNLKTIPSAFQFRMAGYKGVLCQSTSVEGDQVQVRPSQHKFESQHHVLEVIRGSTFISAYLNRQAITLLSALEIPDNVFIEMKDLRVSELDKMLESEHTAMDVLQKNVDEHGISSSLADLVRAGFLRHKDRYLMNLISLFRIMMLRDIKKKAKIRVDKGAFLLGVLDVTETLDENQIYCCVSDPCNPSSRKVITGRCIVFRNPCFHPGDIRIVTAVECEALSHMVDVLVFPAVGRRDIPSECSGGDLDGDDFTVIYDERLIPPRTYEPMNYEAQKPKMVKDVTMDHIKTFFVRYIFSDKLGMIANAHLAKADYFEVGALHGQCIRLAQLHSDAVDFPKTGRPPKFPPELRASKFPDFMEKADKPSYESPKVLGVLYRSINVAEDYTPQTNLNIENFDERLYVEGYEAYLDNARTLKHSYDTNIRGLMNQFGIMTEVEVTSGYIVNTVTKVDKKKPRDIAKSVMDALTPIKRHYRKLFEQEFYSEGSNSIISPEGRSKMESKAYAWYYVTYHPSELGDDASENMISFPWIAHDILCEIAIRNNHKISLTNRVTTPPKVDKKNNNLHVYSNGTHAQDTIKRSSNSQQNGTTLSYNQYPENTKINEKNVYSNGTFDQADFKLSSNSQQNGTTFSYNQYPESTKINERNVYSNGTYAQADFKRSINSQQNGTTFSYNQYPESTKINEKNANETFAQADFKLSSNSQQNGTTLSYNQYPESNNNNEQNIYSNGNHNPKHEQYDDLMVDIEKLKMSIKSDKE